MNVNYHNLDNNVKAVYNMLNKQKDMSDIINFQRYDGNFKTIYNNLHKSTKMDNFNFNSKLLKKGMKVRNNIWRCNTVKKKKFNYFIYENSQEKNDKMLDITNNLSTKTNLIKENISIKPKNIFKNSSIECSLKNKISNNIKLWNKESKNNLNHDLWTNNISNSKKYSSKNLNDENFKKKIDRINTIIKKEENYWKSIYNKSIKNIEYDDIIFFWNSIKNSKSFKDFNLFSNDFFKNIKTFFCFKNKIILDILNLKSNKRFTLEFEIKNHILYNKKFKLKLSDLGYFLMNITDINLSYIIIRKSKKISESLFIVLNGNYKYIYDLEDFKDTLINDIWSLLEKLKMIFNKRIIYKADIFGINKLLLDIYPHYLQMFFN